MSDIENDEKKSLLGESVRSSTGKISRKSSLKSYRTSQETVVKVKSSSETSSPSLKNSSSDDSVSGPDPFRLLDRITYTWNNINVWTGSGSENIAQKGPRKSSNGFLNCCSKLKMRNGVESKQILKNVSGIARPGELLAIMGASGAGKTTLLNVLTFRNSSHLRVSGLRCANGIGIGSNMLTSLSAYVQQDDLFIPTLTVREHLIFQALVRMHSYIPRVERMKKVEQVINELGLTKCADTLIKPGRIKGISGGEMKRLSFASECLTDPSLMFCDEPTSGLDSYMAQNVIEVLKEMTKKGKSIICTIHQPSSELYTMFDKILLMAEGRTVFLGDPAEAVEFFKGQGYPCPRNYNPADFIIQILAIQPGNETTCRKNVKKICKNYDKSGTAAEIEKLAQPTKFKNQDFLEMESTLRNRSPYKAPWLSQFKAVFWRSFISIVKEPMIIRVRLVQTLVVSLLIGALYYGQQLDQTGVGNINGAIFLFLTNMTFQNVFAVINVFCLEMPVFLREHLNGMYRTDVYFLAKIFAELPLFVFFPILFTTICYYIVGLNPDIYRFLIACGIVVLVANAASSFGYMVSCFTPTISMAMAIAPPFIIPFMLFGGFFLNKASVPVYFSWIKYGSWFLYGNELLLINQWSGVNSIDCNQSSTSCPPNGDIVLQTLNFNEDNFSFDLIALAGLVVGFRLLAFLALLSKTYKR